MTWKDKLELGLKNDAASRRDNLPPSEVHGPEEPAGPGRSPVVTEARDKDGPAPPAPATEDAQGDDVADARSSEMESEAERTSRRTDSPKG